MVQRVYCVRFATQNTLKCHLMLYGTWKSCCQQSITCNPQVQIDWGRPVCYASQCFAVSVAVDDWTPALLLSPALSSFSNIQQQLCCLHITGMFLLEMDSPFYFRTGLQTTCFCPVGAIRNSFRNSILCHAMLLLLWVLVAIVCLTATLRASTCICGRFMTAFRSQ